MAISQTTITGSVKSPAGDAARLCSVIFTLSGSDFEAGEMIAAGSVPATVDPDTGTFRVTLWPNDRGRSGDTRYSAVFAFSDGSTVPDLQDLWLRHSAAPVTLADAVAESRLAGMVAPWSLRILRRDEFDALPAAQLPPNSLYLIEDPAEAGVGADD